MGLTSAPDEQNIVEHLSTLRRQFRQHEQFMKSLTESQDSVGRVLHRGNQLVQKLADSQPSSSSDIVAKLAMVGEVGCALILHACKQQINERWERVRARAMERQMTLQTELDTLQKEKIADVLRWLEQFEAIVSSAVPLSDDPGTYLPIIQP